MSSSDRNSGRNDAGRASGGPIPPQRVGTPLEQRERPPEDREPHASDPPE